MIGKIPKNEDVLTDLTLMRLQAISRGADQDLQQCVYGYSRIVPGLHCGDLSTLSVQACKSSYCIPRDDNGPYTHAEVGYPDKPPLRWMIYSEEPLTITFRIRTHSYKIFGRWLHIVKPHLDWWSGGIYGYVPIEEIRRYILKHSVREFYYPRRATAILFLALIALTIFGGG